MVDHEPIRGACNLCEAICGLLLTVEGEQVTAVRGNPADPLSRGHVCPKALALPDLQADPDRLRRPVRRVSTGSTTGAGGSTTGAGGSTTGPGADGWEEIGWDEALDLVAERIAGTINAHGRDAVAVYLGNPNVHSLGSLTHVPVMAKAIGTRNLYSATSVDQLPHQLVAHLLYGHQLLLPIPDLDRTDYFLVLGANPMASNGSLMTVPDFPNRLRGLTARGGRMVVLDPRRTETARVADEHLFVRPGTDAFVLLALLHVILHDGLDAAPAYVDGVAEVRRAVADFTPERAATMSGVAAEDVRRIAHELATAGSAAVYGRVGVSVQEFGLVSQWAIQVLNIVTGNLDRPGGVLFTSPLVDLVGRGLAGRGHRDRWRSRVRGLPEFAGELPVATLADEILETGQGQVRALLTVAGNPASSTPDGRRLGEAIAGLDFMAAVDFYVNETTRHADVILPPTTALERDHYDLVFHALAVRNTARFTPAVLPKPEGSLHDWEIYREITLRTVRLLGAEQSWRRRLVEQVRLRLSPTRTLDLLLRTGSPRSSVRRLRKTPDGIDLGPLRPSLPSRLQSADRRIGLAQPLVLGDLERLAAVRPPAPDQLLLIGRRHQRDNNSWMHNLDRLTRGRPRHQLLMHPHDLAVRGLADGDLVRVTSRVGSVAVEVAATEAMMPGVVSLPHGYGHRREGVRLRRATALPGASINDLTDPERLDASGNAVLTGIPVSVSPLSAAEAALS